MKFIVDAQLPLKLAVALAAAGHDAVHTLNLPDKNLSSDTLITRLADSERCAVVSKDTDFLTSHFVNGAPLRKLEISTGNLRNSILLPLAWSSFDRIEAAFNSVAHVGLQTGASHGCTPQCAPAKFDSL